MPTEAELLRLFIDSSEAVIYLKDEEGRFLMVNKRGAAVAGKTPEEVIGKSDYDYYSKEEADDFRKMDLKVTEAGKPITYKLSVKTVDGDGCSKHDGRQHLAYGSYAFYHNACQQYRG